MFKSLFKLMIVGIVCFVSAMLFRSYLPQLSEHVIASVFHHPIHVWYLVVGVVGVIVFRAVK